MRRTPPPSIPADSIRARTPTDAMMQGSFAILIVVALAPRGEYGVAQVTNTLGVPVYVTLDVDGIPVPRIIQTGETAIFSHRYRSPSSDEGTPLVIRYATNGDERVRHLRRKTCRTDDLGDVGYRYEIRLDEKGAIEIYTTGDGGRVDHVVN